MQIVFRNGLSVNKVGPSDCCLTNSDAYGDDDLEEVVYRSMRSGQDTHQANNAHWPGIAMAISENIARAFQCAPPPNDDCLTDCKCDECLRRVRRFRSKAWRELQVNDLVNNEQDGNIAGLTAAAFQYFLPGAMLLAFSPDEAAWCIADNIVNCLTVSDTEKACPAIEERISRLTVAQRQAVSEWISNLPDYGIPLFSPEQIQNAMDNLAKGTVTPYSHDKVMQWVQAKLIELGQSRNTTETHKRL